MNSRVGVFHCDKCGRAYAMPKELLYREAIDEFEESKQAGFCSPKCLYADYNDEHDKLFVTDYVKDKAKRKLLDE